MKKHLKEQVDAMVAFVNFCNEHGIIWEDVTAFEAKLAAIGIKLTSINSTEEAQEANKKGVAITKSQKKEAMASRAAAVAQPAQSYARSIDNNELYNELSTSYSFIIKAKDQEALTKASFIYDTVSSLPIAEIEKYGITAAVLATLKDAIETFTTVRPTTRNVKTRKTALTKNCKQLVEEGNDLMRLDLLKIGRQFKATHPDFYMGLVENAKVITNSTHAKIRVTALDENNKAPLTGAIVEIEGTSLQGVTDMKGKCTVTKVPDGLRNVTVKKTGYEIFTMSVDFKKGKSNTRTANMMPKETVNEPVTV